MVLKGTTFLQKSTLDIVLASGGSTVPEKVHPGHCACFRQFNTSHKKLYFFKCNLELVLTSGGSKIEETYCSCTSNLFSGIRDPASQRGKLWQVDAPLSVFRCAEKNACPGGKPGSCSGGRVGLVCAKCPDNMAGVWQELYAP